MTITIGIPNYNQKEFIKECIDSTLNQTVKVDEVIFCDDGSTDGSLDVVFDYPVKVISQVNKGLASARNAILMNATSDFVLFLDCDDILLPNAIERILETIKQNPDADIIAPSFKEFGLSDREVILMKDPKLEDFKPINGRIQNRIGYLSAIKRSKLLEIGGYSSRMTWGAEDMHLTINLLTRGAKIVTIPKVLWMYRTKEKSMWTETAKHQEEFTNQIKKDFPQLYD